MEIRKNLKTTNNNISARDTEVEMNYRNRKKSEQAKKVIETLRALTQADIDRIKQDAIKEYTTTSAALKPVSAKEPKENIHKDHRQRLKNQFLENGLRTLTDVQKLELLLFFSIPQKDTNPISHALIEEFGSLSAVFSADYNKLMQVKGVKENTATLITLTKSLINSISLPMLKDYISGTGGAKRYCSKLYVGIEVEQFYVICLNKSNFIKSVKILKSGTADQIDVQIRSITEFALSQNCNRIIISHNHPCGLAAMSDEDCRFTYCLICSCVLNSIEVLDHIIVGMDRSISLFEQHILERLKKRACDSIQISKEKQMFLSSLSETYKICD